MTLTAVAFDLDYTLAVPVRDRAAILADAVDAVGAPDISRAAYRQAHLDSHTHETRAPIFADLLDERDGDVDPADLADAYRAAIADALVPVDGAESLVCALRDDYRVGLLTNGPVTAQRDKIETLGWTDLFDATVVTGDLVAGKPDERAFRAVLDELGTAPAETVYVGDEPDVDVAGAKDAGLLAIQVVYEGGPDPDPRADAHVDRDHLADRLPAVLCDLD
ncbi:HAD family hydrolase [Halobacteriaceae archaeon GCM10025711]